MHPLALLHINLKPYNHFRGEYREYTMIRGKNILSIFFCSSSKKLRKKSYFDFLFWLLRELLFSLLLQSYAHLLVPPWAPMCSLALFVAILHRAAAHAFSKGLPTGLWCVARRTTNGGRRRYCCCWCSGCWSTFHSVQSFKILNSRRLPFICCFCPPCTC